jgi:sarcosine oxidase, subunit beta
VSMRAEVVVVGGGVMGSACAYALAQRGVGDIILLEQEQLAFGSSGASAAVIETQYLDENMIALTNYGHRLCSELERHHGLEFHHNGYLRLAKREQDLALYHESVKIQADLGITGSRVLAPAEIGEVIPGLRVDGVCGALWGPNDGYIDAVRYCEILVSLARERGVRFERGRLSAIDVTGGAVSGVRLADGTAIACSTVVNAAGAWARRVGQLAGLRVPVDGYRRQILILEPGQPFTGSVPFVIEYVPGAAAPGLYFRGDGPRRLIAGLHREGYGDEEAPENPDTFSRGIDWEYAAQLRDQLVERYPAAGSFRPNGGWAGLYPLTPDTKFIVGPAATVPGFHNAVGGGGVGVQSSAGIGAMVADLIVHGSTQVVPHPGEYELSRFGAAAADGKSGAYLGR